MSFSVDDQALAQAEPVGPDGTAATSLDLTNGQHTVVATYSGSADFGSSTVQSILTVGQAPTTLTASAPSLSGEGQQYLLRATLTTEGNPLSGESVSFTALGSPLCQTTTNNAGVATCTVDSGSLSGPSLTTTGYTAIFLGDPSHLPASDHSPIFGGHHKNRVGSHGRSWRRPGSSNSLLSRPYEPTVNSTDKTRDLTGPGERLDLNPTPFPQNRIGYHRDVQGQASGIRYRMVVPSSRDRPYRDRPWLAYQDMGRRETHIEASAVTRVVAASRHPT